MLWEVVVSWTPYNIDLSAFRCVITRRKERLSKDKHTDGTKLSASVEAAVITCSTLSISCPSSDRIFEKCRPHLAVTKTTQGEVLRREMVLILGPGVTDSPPVSDSAH